MSKLPKKNIFIYWKPWDLEFIGFARGQVPSHRLAGYNELANEIPVTYIRCPSRLYQFFHKHPHLWMLFSNLKAVSIIKKENCDIFACEETTATLLLILKRLKIISARITVINIALIKKENREGLRKQFQVFLMKAADRMISFSSRQPEILQQLYSIPLERQTYIPFGIDFNFFRSRNLEAQRAMLPQYQDDREEGYILAAGNPGRDYATLIRAMMHVPEANLRIYTADRRKLDQLFPQMPSNVQILPGNMPYAQLAAVYSRASIGVVPLVQTDQSCGQTVLLEMMAAGLPIVATRVACTEDYAQDPDHVLFVAPGDDKAMAEKIKYLLSHEEEARAMGEAAAARVKEKFTIAHCADQIAEVLIADQGAQRVTIPS